MACCVYFVYTFAVVEILDILTWPVRSSSDAGVDEFSVSVYVINKVSAPYGYVEEFVLLHIYNAS